MTSVVWDQEERSCFSNYTLIFPSVAVGNVGQLAVDLLLNNLNVEHIGYIHHSSILPIVGGDPFHPEKPRLATCCEIYECKDKKLVIIQLRSPVIPSKVPVFISLFTNFIKENKFKRTILLTSSFSQFFTFDDLQGVPVHYLCTTGTSNEKGSFERLSWKEFSLPTNVDSNETSKIPGGGIASYLLEDCESENIPLVVLVLVCSEGNNYPEALQMVKSLNLWLHLKEIDVSRNVWEFPVSWTLPYGSAAPLTIF